jgi:4-hydroxy-tetrahydrodipicolinate synthase
MMNWICRFLKSCCCAIEAGVDGIVLGGSLGEASTLTTAEKGELVHSAIKVLGGKIPVVMNIAEGSTSEALKQCSLPNHGECRD